MQSYFDNMIFNKTPLGKDGSIYQGGGAFERGLKQAMSIKNAQIRSAEEALNNPGQAVKPKPVAEQENALRPDSGFGDGKFGYKKSNPFATRTNLDKHNTAIKEGRTPETTETQDQEESIWDKAWNKLNKVDWKSISESLNAQEAPAPGGMVSSSVQGGGNLGTNYNPFQLY